MNKVHNILDNLIYNDVVRLVNSIHEITNFCGMDEFQVKFVGQEGTPYAGGVWNVLVNLPADYPTHAPHMAFLKKIYHPNIDEHFGTISPEIINKVWTAIDRDLCTMFGSFLPCLLAFPNSRVPLNYEAAYWYERDYPKYQRIIAEHVLLYAAEPEDQEITDEL